MAVEKNRQSQQDDITTPYDSLLFRRHPGQPLDLEAFHSLDVDQVTEGTTPTPNARSIDPHNYLQLVIDVAQKTRTGLEPIERIQIGYRVLLQFMARYDPERSSFTTGAVPAVRSEIRRVSSKAEKPYSITYEDAALLRKLMGIVHHYYQTHGEEISVEELSRKLGAEKNHVIALLQTQRIVYFSHTEGATTTKEETTPDPTSTDPLVSALAQETYAEVAEYLKGTLTQREWEVFAYLTGFVDGISWERKDLPSMLGITHTRVSQLIEQLLRKLKRPDIQERLRSIITDSTS